MKLNYYIKLTLGLHFLINFSYLIVFIDASQEIDLTDRITIFDNQIFRIFFHGFRAFWFGLAGKTGHRTTGKFLQEKFPDEAPFPCDIALGRSKSIPNSVHRLRPDHIWKPTRKALGAAFSNRAVQSFIPSFGKNFERTCDEISKHIGREAFNVNAIIVETIVAIIGETNFGISDKDKRVIAHSLEKVEESICRRILNAYLHPGIFYRLSQCYADNTKYYGKLKSIFREAASERREEFKDEENSKPILIDLLLKYYDDEGFTDEDVILDNAIITFGAGYETASLTISYAILMLAMHPDIDTKVEKEIIENLTVDDEITYENMKNFPYLDMVIKECLRLFPPAPLSIREATEDVHIGDIKVIAAMGDSLTAANGATSTKFLDLTMENRGLSWCIGGQWDWRNATTLANILKVYNPKLVGYSLGDSFGMHKEAQFNLAEIGAVSFDMPYMAKALVKRIKSDPRVNFKKDWKMVTISIGGNDICTFLCAMKDPESLPNKHRRNLYKAVKYLRDNMPRTFVNIVSKPNVETVVLPKDKPDECKTLHFIECSCWQGNTYKATSTARKRWKKIEREFTAVEEEVARSKLWRGLNDFAVVYQPWSTNFSLNLDGRGNDYSLVSFDCFHMSQKGNAYAGTTLYNNLLQRDGEKSTNWASPLKTFLCPTQEHPYIYTYDNS